MPAADASPAEERARVQLLPCAKHNIRHPSCCRAVSWLHRFPPYRQPATVPSSVRRGRSPQTCLSAHRTETPADGAGPTVPLPPSPHFSVGLLRPRPQKRRCPRGKALPKPLSTPFTVRPSLSLLHLVPASSVQRAFPISLHSPPPLRASGPVSHAQERAPSAPPFPASARARCARVSRAAHHIPPPAKKDRFRCRFRSFSEKLRSS